MLKFRQALTARRDAALNGEKKDEGFTLIELLIVVLIIGVLAAIAIPVYLSTVANTQKTAGQQSVSQMITSIAAWSAANNGNVPGTVNFGTAGSGTATTNGSDDDLKKSLPDVNASIKVSYAKTDNHFCLVATYVGTGDSTWWSEDGSAPAQLTGASTAEGAVTAVPAGCSDVTGPLVGLNG